MRRQIDGDGEAVDGGVELKEVALKQHSLIVAIERRGRRENDRFLIIYQRLFISPQLN